MNKEKSFENTLNAEIGEAYLDFINKQEKQKFKFKCYLKVKNLISMLTEYDMEEKVTIYLTNENDLIISIVDKGKRNEH